jgi:fluoride ion exporter CrcB/FEX
MRRSRPAPTILSRSASSRSTSPTWILDSHRLADAGHTRLVWLNIGLSMIAGFAAVALGHWLGDVL